MTPPVLLAPEPIGSDHHLAVFDCGNTALNDWLRNRALKNHGSGASRCFVVCDKRKTVFGYYSLSAGAISHDAAPKAMRRNMPDPIPVLLLGRLAVDSGHHNEGLGKAMLRDAVLRAINVSHEAGIVALLVHAISEEAKRFYLSRGFAESHLQPMTLCLPLATARHSLDD